MSGEDKAEFFDCMCDELDFCLTEFSGPERSKFRSSEDMMKNSGKNANEQRESGRLSLDEVIGRLRKINLMLSADSDNRTVPGNESAPFR